MKLQRVIKLTITSLFLLLTGLLLVVLILPGVFYQIRDVLNPNSITIKSTGNHNIDYIDIFWANEQGNPKKIVSNGLKTNVAYKEYGYNDFYVLYKRDTLISFRYFKTNNWHGHKHIVTLTNDTIFVEIKGPDMNGVYSREL